MQEAIPGKWEQLQNSFSEPQYSSSLGLSVYLAIGGVLAMYLRFLYRRTGRPTSTVTRDSFAFSSTV